MNEPVRLLHLSDIHFRGRAHWDADPVLRALARYIADEVRDGLEPDLVVITGDLAFAGRKEGDGADWRLALLHHPWDYLAEIDTRSAPQAIHLHRDLVLRGHLHEPDACRLLPPDPRRACLELAAGSVYDGSPYGNAFQWIELYPAPRRARVHFRLWNKGAWQVDRNQPGCPSGLAEVPLPLP